MQLHSDCTSSSHDAGEKSPRDGTWWKHAKPTTAPLLSTATHDMALRSISRGSEYGPQCFSKMCDSTCKGASQPFCLPIFDTLPLSGERETNGGGCETGDGLWGVGRCGGWRSIWVQKTEPQQGVNVEDPDRDGQRWSRSAKAVSILPALRGARRCWGFLTSHRDSIAARSPPVTCRATTAILARPASCSCSDSLYCVQSERTLNHEPPHSNFLIAAVVI